MAYWTSTAIMGGQRGVPDLNRNYGKLVWCAGPQPQLWEVSGMCRIEYQKEYQKIYWKEDQIESLEKY